MVYSSFANSPLEPFTQPASPFFPLLVLAPDPADPFVSYMLSAASIDSFLEAGPSAVHYLMAAADPEALRDTVMSRLAVATQQLQQAWKGYLHFTNDTAQLSTVLSQWQSPRNKLVIEAGQGLDVPRLDCRYTTCPWPSEGAEIALVDGTAACTGATNVSAAGSYMLIRLSQKCPIETALGTVKKAGALGAVLAQVPGAAAVPYAGGADFHITMISASAGTQAAALLGSSAGKVNATLPTNASQGEMLAIDALGRLQEVQPAP